MKCLSVEDSTIFLLEERNITILLFSASSDTFSHSLLKCLVLRFSRSSCKWVAVSCNADARSHDSVWRTSERAASCEKTSDMMISRQTFVGFVTPARWHSASKRSSHLPFFVSSTSVATTWLYLDRITDTALSRKFHLCSHRSGKSMTWGLAGHSTACLRTLSFA